jgi:hypothetical protein
MAHPVLKRVTHLHMSNKLICVDTDMVLYIRLCVCVLTTML